MSSFQLASLQGLDGDGGCEILLSWSDEVVAFMDTVMQAGSGFRPAMRGLMNAVDAGR